MKNVECEIFLTILKMPFFLLYLMYSRKNANGLETHLLLRAVFVCSLAVQDADGI